MPTNGELENRLKIYRAAKKAGASTRDSTMIASPGEHPDMAKMTLAVALPESTSVQADKLNNQVISAGALGDALAQHRADISGNPVEVEKAKAQEDISNLPDPGFTIPYDHVDMWRTNTRAKTAGAITNVAIGTGDVVKDLQLTSAVFQAFPMNFQQGLFGALVHESPGSVAARIWPRAIVRDDQGVEKEKALVPQAIKAGALSFLGNATRLFGGTGLPSVGGQAMIQKARETAASILESDYQEGMMTMFDVFDHFEYNQHIGQDSLVNTTYIGQMPFFESIPDVGTPERQVYDQHVRDYVAQNWAVMKDNHPILFNAAAASRSTLAAIGDVVVDPVLFLSDAPVEAFNLARRLLPKSSESRVLGAIASKSGRLDDALDALKSAESFVNKAQEAYRASPSENNAIRLDQARLTYAKARAMVDAGKSIAPAEVVRIPVAPRLKPQAVAPIRRAFENAADGEGFAAARMYAEDQIKALRERQKGVQKILDNFGSNEGELFSAEQMTGRTVEDLQAELKSIQDEMDVWKDARSWVRQRTNTAEEDPTRTLSLLQEKESLGVQYSSDALDVDISAVEPTSQAAKNEMVRQIRENIRRGVASGAPQKEILQWERTMSQVIAGDSPAPVEGVVSLTRDTTNPVDILTEGNVTGRKAILEDPTPVADFSEASDTQLLNRALFGPDESETAGEAIKILAMGGDIDDVGFYGMPLGMYNTSYGLAARPVSGTSGRALSAIKGGKVYLEGSTPPFVAENGLNRFSANGIDYANKLDSGAIGVSEAQGQTLSHGFFTSMRPSEFLDLNEAKGSAGTKASKFILDKIKGGEPVGTPVLNVQLDKENKVLSIVSHKGTGRSAAIRQLTKDSPMPVSVIVHDANGVKIPVSKLTAEELRYPITPGPKAGEGAAEAFPRPRVNNSVEGLDTSLGLPKDFARNPDADWIGVGPVNTEIEAAQWNQTLGEKMGDFWAKALYPRSWNARPAAVIYKMRESMRVLQSTHPKLYTRIHDALHSQEFEYNRAASVGRRALQDLGILKGTGGTTHVDKAASSRFYKIMDMDRSSDEYIETLASLTEKQRRALRVLDEELGFMRDKLGLTDTPLEISGYINHIFDARDFRNGIRINEVLGLPPGTHIFNPALLERTGNFEPVPDLALALDVYFRGASRKLHIEPLLQDLEHAAAQVEIKDPSEKWLAQYIQDIHRNLSGEPTTLGRAADNFMAGINARMRATGPLMKGTQVLGKAMEKTGNASVKLGEKLSGSTFTDPLASAFIGEGVRVSDRGSYMAAEGIPLYRSGDFGRKLLGVTTLTYSSVLAGSSHYFPMAAATGFVTTGGRYGLFKTAGGMLMMGSPEGRLLAKQAGIGKQWEKILGDSRYNAIGRLAANMPTFNGVTGVAPSITATENMIRGWTFHAALSDLMERGGYESWEMAVKAGAVNRLIHESVRGAEEVNHVFGMMGKPAGWVRSSKSGSVAATQFLSFVPKQTEELLAQVMKNPGNIGRYMMLSGFLQRVAAKISIDMSDYVGLGFLPKSPEEMTSITTEAIGSSAKFSMLFAEQAFSGRGDPQELNRASEDWLRSLENFAPLAHAAFNANTMVTGLKTGAIFSNGRKVRDLDLGKYKWDESKSFIENYLAAPKGLIPADGSGVHSTEMPSLLSGLNSPRGRLESEEYGAKLASLKRRAFQRSQLARSLERSLLDGDTSGFNKNLQAAISDGLIQLGNFDNLEPYAIKLAIPRMLASQAKSDQELIDQLEEDKRRDAIYRLRFGK